MKAFNIIWDIDKDSFETDELPLLPSEVEIPDSLLDDIDMSDEYALNEGIGDYLSDEFGFCHSGFELDFGLDADKDIEK